LTSGVYSFHSLSKRTLKEKLFEAGFTGLAAFAAGAVIGLITGRMARVLPSVNDFITEVGIPWMANWRTAGAFNGLFMGSAVLIERVRGVDDRHNTPIGAFVAAGIIQLKSGSRNALLNPVGLALCAALSVYLADVLIPPTTLVEELGLAPQDDASLLKAK